MGLVSGVTTEGDWFATIWTDDFMADYNNIEKMANVGCNCDKM